MEKKIQDVELHNVLYSKDQIEATWRRWDGRGT